MGQAWQTCVCIPQTARPQKQDTLWPECPPSASRVEITCTIQVHCGEHTHTNTHTHMHTHTHTQANTEVNTDAHEHTHIHTHVNAHTHIQAGAEVHRHTYIPTYAYSHAHTLARSYVQTKDERNHCMHNGFKRIENIMCEFTFVIFGRETAFVTAGSDDIMGQY